MENDKLISEIIKERITSTSGEFNANHNISKYIEDGDLERMVNEVEEVVAELLRRLVIDIDNDHNTKETARRVAKMYVYEIFGGRYHEMPRITSFPNLGYKSMYTSGPISIRSVCAHHFQNIVGKCWVGIIPEDEVIGLSKFNRIIHHIAHRPQIQEEMTSQIADALSEYAKTPHVAVILKAEHHCMTSRGVREHENEMVTAIVRGGFFDDPVTRNEFYMLVNHSRTNR